MADLRVVAGDTRPCPKCEGSGEEFDSSTDGTNGFVTDCRACGGEGTVPYRGKHPKETVKGKGSS